MAAAVKWRILGSLSAAEQRTLLSNCQRQRFAKGEHVFHEGDRGDSAYLVDSGTLAVRATTPAGDVVTFDIMRGGDAFGEQALLDRACLRSASVVALERSETLRFSRETFDALWQDHPEVARAVAEILNAHLRATSQALMEALYLSAELRVLRRLGRLADIFANHSSRAIPLTQDDLATLAGATRQTVNKVLRQAQDDGLLSLSRGRITVLDADALARRAR